MSRLEDIKSDIASQYDPDDVVEALDISTEELLDAFEHKLVLCVDKFEIDSEPNYE